MKNFSLISITTLVLSLLTLFSSCEEEKDWAPAIPINFQSDTHKIKMRNKYTHDIYIDASADTLRFKCNSPFDPYITILADPDTTLYFDQVVSSSLGNEELESCYFMDIREQHILRPTIKVDLKDSIISIIVAENTSTNQREFHLVFNPSAGPPALGYLNIFQAGIKPENV
ncbi:hypothetical protein C7Y71_008360 [Pseudoprevotella muciniphila]|uniref:DUF1735 domain-containing protein n=1 Tax=Pseudoprevotella muciniphila TaxID=2133944 RepID=A0A5P8E7R3_9BACT|nr:hypothetical protein [Pseudoprevotella muciniphila]QFQ13031.1 hypothetical protein C7Y71_008360 [Pseudoprevotella muciniphila]